MALAFPAGVLGQSYTEGGTTWIYDGTKWNRQPNNTQKQEISDTAPAAPVEGQRWVDSANGKLYFYVNGTWVQAMIL